MTPRNDLRRREMEHWTTIGVSSLPAGWRNVYRDDDSSLHVEPCPAVLLQEHRGDHISWDQKRPDGTFERRVRYNALEEPYETRAIFATRFDVSCADLDNAGDETSYLGTIGPGEEPESLNAKAEGSAAQK